MPRPVASSPGRTALGLLLALGLAGAAVGDVLLPGTQPADGSGDPAFPAFRNGMMEGSFVAPSQCSRCHEGYRAPGEPLHEVQDTWAGSLMANASRDPLFWAALDIANQDDAALGDVGVGDFCLRCHLPTAWYEGRSRCDTDWGEEFDGSCAQGSPAEPDTDFEGLSCHFCHRMYDASDPPAGEFADPSAPYRGNAQVFLSTTPQVVYGPFSDPQTDRHEFLQLDFYRDSAFCGQCHDVTSPALNRRDPADGSDQGYPMPIERTYTEWLQSAYADDASGLSQSCQECHMPQPDLDGDGNPDAAYACQEASQPRGPGWPLEGPYRTHLFAGANRWMLELLREEYGDLLDRRDSFDASLAATLELLQERTVQVEITAPPSGTAGSDLAVDVRVTNLAGHKFPTGYPEGRRAWIHLAAGPDLDGDGQLAASERRWESGGWDPATGDFQDDPQARVWELKIGVWDYEGSGECSIVDSGGSKIFHFVRNDCIVEDNRIPPLGFVPNAETTPVGKVYPEHPGLPGTLANWDDASYTVTLPPDAAGDWLVVAAVRHQTVSREYVEFLRDRNLSTCDPLDEGCDPTLPDDRPNRGEKMFDLWEEHGRSAPTELGLASASVAIDPAPTGACCVGGQCFELTEWECEQNAGAWDAPGVDCALVDCMAPVEPAPGEARDLRVAKDGLGGLALSWTPACDATDHAVVLAPLGEPTAWSAIACGLGPDGAAALTPAAGSWAFVVTGRNSTVDGSLGRDSAGTERPESVGLAPCDYPQDLGATCE